jgi:diguanylate cyclase (GGDEF)-like protein
MLGGKDAAATLAVSDLQRARDFYENTLGLAQAEETPGAVLYKSGNSVVLVYPSEFAGTNKATAASWAVGDDFDAIVQDLKVLAVVGATIASNLRASDFAGRYGGEEFNLLLPDTDRDGAVVAAETLREAITGVDVPGVSRPISASFGVAAIPDDAAEPSLVLRSADRALYTAKARGRNRVEILATNSGESVATNSGDSLVTVGS